MIDDAPFAELIAALRRHGREADAAALESLKVVGWASAGEMIREMGQALLDLQPGLPAELEPLAARCLEQVRSVSPRIGPRKGA